VILAAHPPGEMLAMETLRQAAIAGHALPDGVIPTSPDLDAAPFRPQAARIGTLPGPFAIFVSGRCRAPPLSARIARAGERLGVLRGAGQVADLAVTMLGVTAYDSGGAEHFTAGGFPALVAMPSRMRALAASHDGPEAAPVGLLPGTVLMLQDATRAVLDPPLP
jgi:esterase/lipase superfamily enzyme